ncbi:MAG: helix-turn-helix domain-containing protein [Alphaproteobacteria bacterium]|nr:helix-turn-helix domain-containing protein [Alphaproteobacteria bacterium]
MEIQDFIIEKLRLLIKTKYTKQKIFCEKFGIDNAQFSRYLNGKTAISIDLLDKISKFANISMSYFFNDESNLNIDEDLFNEVVNYAYNFAKEHNVAINGKILLSCYQSTKLYLNDNPNISVENAFNNLKPILLNLMKLS